MNRLKKINRLFVWNLFQPLLNHLMYLMWIISLELCGALIFSFFILLYFKLLIMIATHYHNVLMVIILIFCGVYLTSSDIPSHTEFISVLLFEAKENLTRFIKSEPFWKTYCSCCNIMHLCKF